MNILFIDCYFTRIMSPTLRLLQVPLRNSPFWKIRVPLLFSSLSDLCLLKSSNKAFMAETVMIMDNGINITGFPSVIETPCLV